MKFRKKNPLAMLVGLILMLILFAIGGDKLFSSPFMPLVVIVVLIITAFIVNLLKGD